MYEIPKPYLKFVTDGREDGQAQSNMPLQLFQSWGHKKYSLCSAHFSNGKKLHIPLTCFPFPVYKQ